MVGQMWQQQDMAVAPQELSPNAAVSRNTRDADKASGLQLLDPKQRKRIQNRIAQRTYREPPTFRYSEGKTLTSLFLQDETRDNACKP